ncbi:MAG TPA: response regulator [Planctomycetota bacterium]|nr:response regulator [Planctomycetota bacterium]
MLQPLAEYSSGEEERGLTHIMVGTKRTILVVDDDADIRDSLTLLLSLEHYVVRLAENREEALKLLANGEPDVVLLDWFMPGLPVEDFVEKAREQYPSIQIVLVSASLNTRQKARALKLKHYLTKPFEPEDVLKTVEACIRHRRRG